uniref:Cytochrome c biogenesis protein CcsA n=1 Tax=Uronema confervicola TaxID=764120 RepID=A0A6H1U6X8_9CHLO|nr:heme attachment to plastid cytochrome c [Uronema confervicola]QIZ74186.1 heme attachment to plastid cytochrome c [Uronema confervicola]
MSFNFENFISNLSFCLLFITMLSYFISIVFPTNSKLLLTSRVSMFFTNVSLFSFLALRWKESGHFPLSNLYESLIFLSWSLTFIQLWLEKDQKIFFVNSSKLPYAPFLGALIAPSALLTYAFATFTLPQEMQKTSALVPALQSNWLIMHVTIMILSYAVLICGCLFSIAFLIITRGQEVNLTGNSFGNESFTMGERSYEDSSGLKDYSMTPLTNDKGEFFRQQEATILPSSSLETNSSFSNLNPVFSNLSLSMAINLDNYSYRILGVGFPLLTIGILSGSVWANEAWGSYWSWDPKETWALLTWFVFAIYLHTRLTKGWQGKKPALIASVGFLVVWICYIGVNLLGKGLHSYGWINNV